MALAGKDKRKRMDFLAVSLLVLLNGVTTNANWMYLSLSSVNKQGTIDCHSISNINQEHKRICKNQPEVMRTVGRGIKVAIDECQRQFFRERWNCPVMESSSPHSVFGPTLDRGTKETAFIHAITSAGVAFSVTDSCSKGIFPNCDKCDKIKKGSVDKSGEWKWGDCNVNVYDGLTFAEEFIDSAEAYVERIRRSRRKYLRKIMNLHNNGAGRLALLDSMMSVCGCTGVSGSCATKVCQRIMPPFKTVGEHIKKLYKTPVKMSTSRRGRKQIREAKVSKARQLIYFEKSPNYCFSDKKRGVLGISGRVCNISSTEVGSCRILCCGHGYNIQIRRNVKRCNCKFKWCCNVDCDICESLEEVHTCK